MMIAYTTQSANPDKIAGSPDAYLFAKYEIDDERQAEFEGNGFTVVSQADFDAYMAIQQPIYDAWYSGYQAALAVTPAGILLSVKQRQDWADGLMDDLKTMNIQQGLNLAQALWFHSRMRSLEISVLQAHATALPSLQPLVGMTLRIDLMNLVVSGDVETAYAAVMIAPKDDMTQPFHVFSQAMADYIMNRIAQEFFT